jgi:hypothetical protein
MSVVEFMLSSFPSVFFEGWSVVERGVDAKLFFGRLMAATTAAPRRIILRRDKQLDPSSESGDMPDSASFVCVGMFIAISSVALGSEAECLQIAFLAFLEETNSHSFQDESAEDTDSEYTDERQKQYLHFDPSSDA